MNKLLSLSPKKLLRKTIIVSLGYERQNASLETVMNEFQSDKEEIQLAVLDALKVAHQYKATQFMVKIIMAQERSKSLRVRMNATRIVAGIYGRRAIPFLLNGLEDPDPRIVANTLETLSIYKDKALLPYFMKFLPVRKLSGAGQCFDGALLFQEDKRTIPANDNKGPSPARTCR